MPYVVEPMVLADIPEVTAIERQSFTSPWPVYAYRREIKDNRNSRYIVIRWIDEEAAQHRPPAPPIPMRIEAPAAGQEEKRRSQTGSIIWRVISRVLPARSRGEDDGSRPPAPRGAVVGYAGLWLVLDEGHVTTIAVRPDCRGLGLGEVLLARLIEIAQEMGAKRMTLEVRVSNEQAQNLYRKYSFKVEGVRRRYYSDDNEDALIMWSEPIDTPEFQALFSALRERIGERLGSRLAGF